VVDPLERIGKHTGRTIDAFEPIFPALEDGYGHQESLQDLAADDPK
jgi:hypothetical protein